ncbi:MAG: AMP-binding protein [Candidatus Poribacteria bacterium]
MTPFYHLESFLEETVLIYAPNELITYRDLIERSSDIEQNLEPRHVVFIFCQNSDSSLLGYLACLRKKSVAVLIPHQLDKTLLAGLLEAYKPSYLYFPSYRQDLNESGKELCKVGNYILLKTMYQTHYEVHPDIAILMTTSGSTGSPKLVKLSYLNLNENAKSISEYLNIKPNDRAISTMPMSYAYGLSIINSHLMVGASLVLTELSMVEHSFWEILKMCEVTNFGGVPYTYKLLKRLKFNKMNLPSIKYITQAGGKLGSELTREFVEVCNKKGVQFYTMYGQTEATARMSYLHPNFALAKVGSIGQAIPGGEFWLEDENRNKIRDPETIGELVYRGKNVCMGYTQRFEDLSQGDENGGVLRTGDFAKRSEDGFYEIMGRKNRFVKIYGHRINLDEVETIADQLGYECVCLGVDDVLKIYTTSKLKDQKIKGDLSRMMGIHHSAFEVIYIDSIPRSSSGKILYNKLNGITDSA